MRLKTIGGRIRTAISPRSPGRPQRLKLSLISRHTCLCLPGHTLNSRSNFESTPARSPAPRAAKAARPWHAPASLVRNNARGNSRVILADPAGDGLDLIWKGNQPLLYHHSAAPAGLAGRLRSVPRRADHPRILDRPSSYFPPVDQLQPLLLRTRSLPDFRIFHQRWFSITEGASSCGGAWINPAMPKWWPAFAAWFRAGPHPSAWRRDARRAVAAISSGAAP